MKRQIVSSGARWESLVGYSRAVRVGQWVSVAGTTAASERGGAVGGDDIGEQTREALRRIEVALEQVGALLAPSAGATQARADPATSPPGAPAQAGTAGSRSPGPHSPAAAARSRRRTATRSASAPPAARTPRSTTPRRTSPHLQPQPSANSKVKRPLDWRGSGSAWATTRSTCRPRFSGGRVTRSGSTHGKE